MASHALRPHHVDSAPAPTAHRPSYYTTIRTNHSTPSRPVALKTLIWCRSSRGNIGLPGWTMICHNRPQSLETHFSPSARGPGMHHTAFMDCCRRVSSMGGGEKHAPRTHVASSQQFVSRRQRYLVAQEKFTEPPLTAIGHQGRPGTALLVLPRFIVWWSPRKDADPGEAVSPLLLVRYV